MVNFSWDLWPAHVTLVALYLRGADRPFAPARRMWPGIVRVLRADDGPPLLALRRAGLWCEASLLEDVNLMRWAERHASSALTPLHPDYPERWLTRLGDGAPPALWFRGGLATPLLSRPRWLGVVGSRAISPDVERFAHAVGEEAVRLGYDVVSGGAVGCDSAASRGARSERSVRLLPHGLNLVSPSSGLDLSVCATDEPFSTANAMERNALIYASAEATVVVHARFREGGTWHGATDALRRRLGPLLIREDQESAAHRALVALGAKPMRHPADLASVIASPSLQPGLFTLA